MRINSTDLNEVNYTFFLSIRYGLTPDTASYVLEHAGKMEEIHKYIMSKLNKFFADERKVHVLLDCVKMKAEHVPMSKIQKKYENEPQKVNSSYINEWSNKFEIRYNEIKGLMELDLLSYEDHEMLKEFMESYAPYCVDAQKEKVRNVYEKYKNKLITKKALVEICHMKLPGIEKFLAE